MIGSLLSSSTTVQTENVHPMEATDESPVLALNEEANVLDLVMLARSNILVLSFANMSTLGPFFQSWKMI